MTLKKCAMAALLALAAAAPIAQAAVSVISFQDDDIDFLLRPNGTTGVLEKATGAFQAGDVLVAVFEMPTYTINSVSQLTPNTELTGIAIIQIAGFTNAGATAVFQAYTGGFNAVSPVDVVNGGAGGGATIAMWLNSTTGAGGDTNVVLDAALNPAASCTSLANCLDQVSRGSLVQVDGFGGDADDFWTSTGLIGGAFNTNTVLGIGPGQNVALFNAAQTTFFNSTGPIVFMDFLSNLPCPAGSLALDGCVQGPAITGAIQGGGGTTPLNAGIVADGAFSRSDVDAVKLQEVPEPGTLALVGMSLLGLAGGARRMRK